MTSRKPNKFNKYQKLQKLQAEAGTKKVAASKSGFTAKKPANFDPSFNGKKIYMYLLLDVILY